MTSGHELAAGESIQVPGSRAPHYTVENRDGAYVCTCQAWHYQRTPIERRSCKHIRRLRGEEAETARLAAVLPARDRVKVDPPALLLASVWDGVSDLKGWWLSEKLDGVRAYWTGSAFVSRNGNRFPAPTWFCEGLPSTPLDGELWIGRKQFQRTVGIVRSGNAEAWRSVRFLTFDAPHAGGEFERRQREIPQLVAAARYAQVLGQAPCGGMDHLRAELTRVEGLGGEGLMFRRPGSAYEIGRCGVLVKIKTFLDAEAVVLGHESGTGRHKGRLGSLRCVLANGTQFLLGCGLSDAERRNPPAIGSTVTFRYQELTNRGVPRFPFFVGVRVIS